jgi:uncharacterized protein
VPTRVPPRRQDQSVPRKTGASETETKESKKGYAAFGAGDIETVMSDYDDDVEFVVAGNSAVSGTYRGKAGVAELFAKVAEKSFAIVPSRFLADDDVVVVLSQVTAGGESAPEADVFTFRDGKIVKAQNLGDTAMFERVFGTK